jgi:protein TonB
MNLFVRGRMMTVLVSGLLHVGLVAGLLLGERWVLSANASRLPVLPVELVAADAPPTPVLPAPAPPRPKPPPPRPVRIPRPIETPLPQMAETRAEPAPVTPSPPAAQLTPPASTGTPATDPAPAVTVSGPPVSPVSGPSPEASNRTEGVPIGSGPPAPASTPVTPSPNAGSALASRAVTTTARPQGGYQVRPSYPAAARRLGIQGTTLLRVHVLVDGRVGDVVVQETAGHPDLDRAATEAVQRWRFEPARRGDDPVAMWVMLPVEFRLK